MNNLTSKINQKPVRWTLLFCVIFFGIVIGGKPTYEEVVADLSSEDAEVRLRAIFFLTQIKRSDHVHHMIPAYSDPDPDVRKEAIRATAKMRNPFSVDALVKGMHADPKFTEEYLNALSKLDNPAALPHIRPYLDHEDKDVRKVARKGVEEYEGWVNPWETIDSEGNQFGARDEIIPDLDQLRKLLKSGASQ